MFSHQFQPFLTRHRALGRASSESLARLVASSTLRRLARGDTVYRAGADPEVVTLVVSGLAAQFIRARDDRSTLLSLSSAGTFLEVGAMLRGDGRRRDVYAFMAPTVVADIPREVALDALRGSADGLLALLHDVAAEQDLYARHLSRIAMGAAQHLAAQLIELAQDFGDEMYDGTTAISLRLTRHHLSMFIGTTVETVARTMSAWTREGILTTDERGIVILDVPRLRAIAEEQGIPAAAVG